MWRRQWPEGEVLLTLGHSRQDKMRLGRGSKNSPHNATKSRIRKTAVIEISDAFAALLNRHRGDGRPSAPATPPYMRVRIRRLSELPPHRPSKKPRPSA